MINFSNNFQESLNQASQLAIRTGGLVCTEHLLYGLVSVQNSNAEQILFAYGIQAQDIISQFTRKPITNNVEMSSRASRAIDGAKIVAEQLKSNEVGTEHLLFALIDDKTSVASKLLVMFGVNLNSMQKQIYNIITQKNGFAQPKSFDEMNLDNIMRDFLNMFGTSPLDNNNACNMQNNNANSNSNRILNENGDISAKINLNAEKSNNENVLDKFGVDLTQKAKDGKIDPVIGRGKEIERIIQILCRRTKNNPILIGEPGVGKSAVVDGLAQAIVNGKVPDVLAGKTIFSLDITSMVAGTRYRGDLKKDLKEL